MSFHFGLAPPEHVNTAWSARAILKGGFVDILHDRQSWKGSNDAIDKLCRRMNKAGVVMAVRREAERLYEEGKLHADKGELFQLDKGEFHCEFDSRGSCGYLYITVY